MPYAITTNDHHFIDYSTIIKGTVRPDELSMIFFCLINLPVFNLHL